MSWRVVLIYLYLEILLLSMPLSHNFVGRNLSLLPGQETLGTTRKGVGFLSAFVPDPPQYIPVGELDTENSVLVERGYSRGSVHMHALAWNLLSTALKSKSDKSILYRCTSPREARDDLLA